MEFGSCRICPSCTVCSLGRVIVIYLPFFFLMDLLLPSEGLTFKNIVLDYNPHKVSFVLPCLKLLQEYTDSKQRGKLISTNKTG